MDYRDKSRYIKILTWLKTQRYQSERTDNGEYVLFYEKDIPNIVMDYNAEFMDEMREKIHELVLDALNRDGEFAYKKDGKTNYEAPEDAVDRVLKNYFCGFIDGFVKEENKK